MYKVNDPEDRGYWQLQKNQAEIGWDNLIQGNIQSFKK